jgi:predicted ester cyclase
MTAENNKSLSKRFFEEAFGRGNLKVVDEIFSAQHTNHGPGAMPNSPDGPEGMKQLVTYYRNAFPDTMFTIDEQVAEGDRVVTRWTARGTQKGEMPGIGIPVTGKPVTISGVSVDRFANGKIIESWGLFDQLGLMQQLGVIPNQMQSRT